MFGRGGSRSPRHSQASVSPGSTRSPTVFSTMNPAAGSISSSRRRRPHPMSIERNPIFSVEIDRTYPPRRERAGMRCRGCGRRAGSSTTFGFPPWKTISSSNFCAAAPESKAFSSLLRASSSESVRSAKRSISTPSRRQISRTRSGPSLRSTRIDSSASRALPTARPSGRLMSVIQPVASRPAARDVSTRARPSSRDSSTVFRNAPSPVLTSKTMPVVPDASFLDRMEATMSEIDSTVPVTSRRA